MRSAQRPAERNQGAELGMNELAAGTDAHIPWKMVFQAFGARIDRSGEFFRMIGMKRAGGDFIKDMLAAQDHVDCVLHVLNNNVIG